jgi:hypothetical protein
MTIRTLVGIPTDLCFLADATLISSQILHRPRLNLRKICAFEICVKSARKLNASKTVKMILGVQQADSHHPYYEKNSKIRVERRRSPFLPVYKYPGSKKLLETAHHLAA